MKVQEESESMSLINEVIQEIEYLHTCRSGYLLAHALYSACHHGEFPGPNLLSVSASLDSSRLKLFSRLTAITHERDYSNYAQDQAREWIEKRFAKSLSRWKKGHSDD